MAYDFQALKPHLKTYLDTHLQASPKAGPGFYECPLCSSGTGPKGTGAFHLQGDSWTCFSCGERGDITDLHAETTGLPRGEAALDLAKTYNLQITDREPVTVLQAVHKGHSPTSDYRAPSPTGSYGEPDIAALQGPQVDYSPWLEALADTSLASNPAAVAYLEERGLDPAAMQGKVLLWDGNALAGSAWSPAWNREGKNSCPPAPSLVFPYPGGKYWHARILRQGWSHPWDKPPAEVAGKDPLLGTEARLTSGQVYIVEGMTDAFALQAAGQAVICLSGTSGARTVANILRHESYAGVEVVEALDLDKQGRDALDRFKEVYKGPVLSLWDYVEDLEGIKDPGELAGRSQTALQDAISRVESPESRYLHQSVGAGLSRFLDGIKAQDSAETLSTGFLAIDNALDGGFHPGLYILGALSSLGKTTLALQIADHIAATDQRDVLVISLEQGQSELVAKSLSRLTRALADERRRGALVSRDISTHGYWSRWTEPQQETFSRALEAYREGSSRLWIKDGIGDIGVTQIRDLVEAHTRLRGQAPFVVVDYLQILAPVNERVTDKMNTDKAVTELKRLSRDYQTPVLAISSLNRGSYSGPVSMEAFKESGAIEYGSDVLLGLQVMGLEDGNSDKDRGTNKRRVEDSKLNAVRGMEPKVLKNRNGRTGTIVPLKFEAMYSYFETADVADIPGRPGRTF